MYKMTRIALSVGLAAGLATGSAMAEAAESWKMATPWSGGPWLERDAETFANYVNQLTGGEIEIEVFPGGTLGGPCVLPTR